MKYKDIADIPEDERIQKIGNFVMSRQQVVGFITDSEPGKADRYIAKLQERFPGIVILGRYNGPVANTVTVKVGPPSSPSSN